MRGRSRKIKGTFHENGLKRGRSSKKPGTFHNWVFELFLKMRIFESMKRTVLFLCALAAVMLAGCAKTSNSGSSASPKNPEIAAAKALAWRVMGPKAAAQVEFRLINEASGLEGTEALADTFRVEALDGRTIIWGNSAGSMAVGLNQYLRRCCRVSVGWFKEDRVRLPKRLPLPEEPIAASARVPQRFFLNYCTSGYTLPWWKWEDWEWFIDWMALNGVNLPLAMTGQEAIWYEVWTEMGLTDEEVRGYFTGPGHLPWHRMRNIDRWGGPLPKSWLAGQAELQKKIVARERELSMRPVLPASPGHVPAELARLHPEAKISPLSEWAGFKGEYVPSFLDPMDPLFPQIQKSFMEKQDAMYGSSHVYGIDLFNEMVPPSWEPEYLARVGRTAYEALAAVDPEAVWLQMGWLFWYQSRDWTPERVKAYLTASPAESQILLDYYCEVQEVRHRTDNFFGVPYVWCYLGDFGGNTMRGGDLYASDSRIEEALVSGGDNLCGIGCTLEALDCNPYSYEYVLSKVWNSWGPEEFAASLAECRSGVKGDGDLADAWRTLFSKVYGNIPYGKRDGVLNQRPGVNVARGRFDSTPDAQYDNAVLSDMLQALLDSGGSGRAYEFDLVNISRQWLTNICSNLYLEYRDAYRAGDRTAMQEASTLFLEVMDDLDAVLAYEPYFLLGKWIADARAWGADRAEADYFERNARNLITTWGDRGSDLCDYAERSINGLVSAFYKPRWEMFFKAVESELDGDGEFSAEDAARYNEEVCDFEADWWKEMRGRFRSKARGAGLEKEVRYLIEKYLYLRK